MGYFTLSKIWHGNPTPILKPASRCCIAAATALVFWVLSYIVWWGLYYGFSPAEMGLGLSSINGKIWFHEALTVRSPRGFHYFVEWSAGPLNKPFWIFQQTASSNKISLLGFAWANGYAYRVLGVPYWFVFVLFLIPLAIFLRRKRCRRGIEQGEGVGLPVNRIILKRKHKYGIAILLIAALSTAFLIHVWKRYRFTVNHSPAFRIITIQTLRQIEFGLNAYHQKYGRYPTGGNKQIVAALRGPHPPGTDPLGSGWYVQDTPGGRPVVNFDGQFQDQWGHPLVIHDNDATTRPVIYSKGANGMDDNLEGDDVVASVQTIHTGE